MQVTLDFASFSDSGPRPVNEDAVLLLQNPDGLLLAVADGVGGHRGGRDASDTAIRILAEDAPQSFAEMSDTFGRIHEAILSRQLNEPDISDMATTLTAVYISSNSVVGAHTGDCRCVLARGVGIKKLTQEHTEANRLYAAGKLTKAELLTYPRRNIIDSALGATHPPRIDKIEHDLRPGDRLFIMSDGVYDKIPLRALRALISTTATASEAVDSVICDLQTKGPEDNYSIVAAYLS